MQYIQTLIEQAKDKVESLLAEERNRTALMLGTAALVITAYLFLLFVPQMIVMGKKTREIRDLRNKIEVTTRRLKQLDKLKKKLETLEEEQSKYAAKLPMEDEIPQLLKGIASIAEETGVKIQSITPNPGKNRGAEGKDLQKNEYYRELPILFCAKSGYHQLGHFVNRMEQGYRFIGIEELKIRNNPGSIWKHDVTLVLKTYVALE